MPERMTYKYNPALSAELRQTIEGILGACAVGVYEEVLGIMIEQGAIEGTWEEHDNPNS